SDCRGRALVALERQGVLLSPCHTVAFRDVLRGYSHEDIFKWIGERTVKCVYERGVPQFVAPTYRGSKEGRTAHHFGATSDSGVAVTEQDCLGRRDDGLQS